jgi:hypothetical protein
MLGIDPGQRMYLSEQLLREQSEAKRVMFDALAGSVTNGEHRVLDHALSHLAPHRSRRRRRPRDPRHARQRLLLKPTTGAVNRRGPHHDPVPADDG